MDSLLLADALVLPNSSRPALVGPPSSSALRPVGVRLVTRHARRSGAVAAAGGGALMTNGSQSSRNGVCVVGDFMTKKEKLHVVKPNTAVDTALDMLVEYNITGFPVIDDNWRLIGVVSDYDLLSLDSISGSRQTDTCLFPDVDSTWKTFYQIQKLMDKTNGKVVGDVMTTYPLVVRESSNLEDAARLLLETKYRRLPVVDATGKLVGIITRGNVVRAALQINQKNGKKIET